MGVPSRRTLVVLVTLIGAMTLISGLLLSLEPGPTAPWDGLSFRSLDRTGAEADPVVDTLAVPPGDWQAIGIHFSGSAYGSAQTLAQDHAAAGLPTLGFHFVIGNGSATGDGAVEVGERWRRQTPGLSALAAGTVPGRRVIDICLIGDGATNPPSAAQMAELVRIVHELQQRFQVPAERVLLYSDPATGRGQLFPGAQFQQQLYTYAGQ
jgi:hypothetical protein